MAAQDFLERGHHRVRLVEEDAPRVPAAEVRPLRPVGVAAAKGARKPEEARGQCFEAGVGDVNWRLEEGDDAGSVSRGAVRHGRAPR